jgi:hypothetical protein
MVGTPDIEGPGFGCLFRSTNVTASLVASGDHDNQEAGRSEST